MIRVIQRRLIIPRGDTGTFTVPALSPGATGSVGVFTIFDPITKIRVFQKKVDLDGDVFNIEFSHGDTVNLQAGDYLWDIKFYKDPVIENGKVISGTEIDSYYAAFQTPKCEIRETGDDFMAIEGTPVKVEDLNIILAATQAANAAKIAAEASATEAAEKLEQMVAAIPTKISDLVDDSGHYTKPASGIPASDLAETYLTEHQDLSNYVQKTDYATDNEAGVVKVFSTDAFGISLSNGVITTKKAKTQYIKNPSGFASAQFTPIVPYNQHSAAFYGLAKAAGDTTQTLSNNEVGTYTDAAKAAIQAMLDVPSTADIPTNVSELTNDAGYLTQHQDISGKANSADLAAVATSGSYDDLSNKPTIPEVPVQDVQIEGTSILENGIANISIAQQNVPGLFHSSAEGGFSFNKSNGVTSIAIKGASPAQAKAGTESRRAIVPYYQHYSIFYGLSKVAGVDLANEEVTLGTYPAAAKTAIQQMLGVPAASAIPTLVSQLTNDSGYLTSFTETDPTVPSWAKAAQKPTYTAAEVGAPTVQEMTTAIGNAIGNINSFDMVVVQALPTQDISTHTIYLVPKTGETNDVYDEYVYINSNWEMVGNTQVDLSNYVQKTDYASGAAAGIVKVPSGGGITVTDGSLYTVYANSNAIKTGTNKFNPIVPYTEHQATFYGLAKAAGDTTQSQSDNAVGTYTNEAKAAIKNMLGVPSTASDIGAIPAIPAAQNGTGLVYVNGEWKQQEGYGYSTTIDSFVMAEFTASDFIEYNTKYVASVPMDQDLYALLERMFFNREEFNVRINDTVYNSVADEFTYTENPSIYLEDANSNKIFELAFYGSNMGLYVSTIPTSAKIYGSATTYTVFDSNLLPNNNVAKGTGDLSVVLNQGNIASGESSTAEGYNTVASGVRSHAEGFSTIAASPIQHAQGKYNVEDNYNLLADIIGNGTADNARSNAYALTWTGDGKYAGDLYVHANADSTGGNKVATVAELPDMSLYAAKADTILDTTLSRGRKDNTTVGTASLAFGIDAEASGYYSVSLGLNTTASSQGAFAEGKNTVAHYIAHAEGEDTQALGQWAHSQGVGTVANGAASFAGGDNTIANGHSSFVTGRYNAADSYDNWPTWTANTSYEVGDRVKREQLFNNEPTIMGYICKEANTDETFDISHWDFDSYHMNYVEIVGNGNEYEDPETHQMVRVGSNAYALEWNGTAHYAGDVYVGANPDSTGGVKLATLEDIPNVPVQDVQVNGTSILQNGVANVPVAGIATPGVVKVVNNYGLDMSNGYIVTKPASASEIKTLSPSTYASYHPIVPSVQHYAAFYGLAKAAGDSTQSSSSNAVGTYTDTAKQKIQNMLGITNLLSTEETTTATAAHALNSLFLMGGKLYKATAAIAIGDAVEVGTNCEVVKVEDVFVKNTDYASASAPGVVKVSSNNGTQIINGVITTYNASDAEIKAGNSGYKILNANNQHKSVFYGLSKVAGVDLANETVTLGTYPETSKAAIRTLIGAGTPLDVQIDGTSIVSNGIATIPVRGNIVSGSSELVTSHAVYNTLAGFFNITDSQIKGGTQDFRSIAPITQHKSVFYGLAKAAGDTTQSASSNAVGAYTDSAKASIKSMLGIVDGSTGTVDITGTTPSITAVENTRYVCGEVSTLSFTPAASGICIVRFTSGSTATVLTVPNTVKFPEWFDITALEADTIYEICVTDGVYGAVMSWAL